MKLFNFSKKQSRDDHQNKPMADSEIIVLGSGCKKCNDLETSVKNALIELKKGDIPITHITDFSEIAKYGVMSTPALVLDGKVVSYGKVLKKAEALKILTDFFKEN